MTFTRYAFVCIALLQLVACGSGPVQQDRYYSLVLAANNADVPVNDATSTRLVVGPIELPSYLGNRGIAMQTGPNRIESANHHFWAEPLDEAIAKVLVQDIAERAHKIAVERDSGRWTPAADCRVRVEFDAFHPTNESRVVSSGRYWILSEDSSETRTFGLSQTLTIDGYAHAVDALRGTLELLATQIAAEVQAVSTCTG